MLPDPRSSDPSTPSPIIHPTDHENDISVSETSEFGGWVWVLLFGFVILLSVLSNVTLTSLVLTDRRKRANLVYALTLALFALNIVDYALLAFDFSLGLEQNFTYGQIWCTGYQVALKINPVLKSAVIVALLIHTARTYLTSETEPSRSRPLCLTLTFLVGVTSTVILSLPTVFLAEVVQQDEELTFCELVGDRSAPMILPIYHLVYSAMLTYWIPLMISFPFLLRLFRWGSCDKHPEVGVALSAALSFFCFHLLHAGVITTAYVVQVAGMQLTEYHSWMIKVLQSLLLLLAYFSHVSRPCLILLLDPDIKDRLMSGCTGIDTTSHNNQELQVPLCRGVPDENREGQRVNEEIV